MNGTTSASLLGITLLAWIAQIVADKQYHATLAEHAIEETILEFPSRTDSLKYLDSVNNMRIQERYRNDTLGYE
jgi:hypothetical protein